MRPGNNPIEKYKAQTDGLDLVDELPKFIEGGWQSLTDRDKELLKWLGIFWRKRTEGKFMMRIRLTNGFVHSAQIRSIATLSKLVGYGFLDITTRQQIELRGYQISDVPFIWDALKKIDLTSLQTGMDNIRNINGCPLSGLTPQELFDASPASFAFTQRFLGNKEFTNLPRKFNVTFTGCRENCTHNASQDIAMTPAIKKYSNGEESYGFNVAIGGKMGSGGYTPALPLDLFVRLESADEIASHITFIFRDHGPRDSRTRCRLWFLLKEWGVERYRAELSARCARQLETAGEDARLTHQSDHLGIQPQKQPGLYSVGLLVSVGRMKAEQAEELARLADTYGTGEIRLTTDQNVILVNIPQKNLELLLREPLLEELKPDPSAIMRGLVSCTGVQYCNLALIETKNRAIEVAKELEKRLSWNPKKPLAIHWSGCPAGCGNHHAADVGLQGIRASVNGKMVDAVQIFVGGKSGPSPRIAEKIMELVPCDEVLPALLETIIKNLELFKNLHKEDSDKDRVIMVPEEAPGGV